MSRVPQFRSVSKGYQGEHLLGLTTGKVVSWGLSGDYTSGAGATDVPFDVIISEVPQVINETTAGTTMTIAAPGGTFLVLLSYEAQTGVTLEIMYNGASRGTNANAEGGTLSYVFDFPGGSTIEVQATGVGDVLAAGTRLTLIQLS